MRRIVDGDDLEWGRRQMSNRGQAFFRPLWRRIAIVAVCAGWTVLEWVSGQQGWAAIAAAVTAYGAWSFFIAWKDPPPGSPGNP